MPLVNGAALPLAVTLGLLAAAALAAPLPAPQNQNEQDQLAFLSIGDWGQVNADQAAVAKTMGEVADEAGSSFVLSTGDNFYPLGVTGNSASTDKQWNETFENVYVHPSLQTPWYSILGNHDHYGIPWMEVEQSQNNPSGRWKMPSPYYTFTKTLTDGTTVQYVMIDTIVMSPGSTLLLLEELARDVVVTIKHLLATKKSLENSFSTAPKQLRWLEDTLANCKADFLIVCGHYPVYSGGEHGNTAELHKHVLPMLHKYSVDAYISGHDHTLQHLNDGKVDYFVSGNGAKRGKVKNIEQTKFAVVDPGFMLHQVSPSGINTTFVDGNGQTLYTAFTARKRNL